MEEMLSALPVWRVLLVAAVFVLGAWQQSTLGGLATHTELKAVGLLAFAAMLWYPWRTPCVNRQQALGGFAHFVDVTTADNLGGGCSTPSGITGFGSMRAITGPRRPSPDWLYNDPSTQ